MRVCWKTTKPSPSPSTGITSSDANVSLGATVSDTVTIADDDLAVVTIRANDGTAAEPGDNGQFTVTLSNPSDTDTVISYSISGDATPGSDYTALTGSVTILANATTATIDVSVIDENLLEDNETVTVTLTGITSGDADISLGATVSDTVTIADNDAAVVTIQANDANAAEPGNSGQFTVTLSNPSDTDTVVSYSISGDATPGSDYTTLTGSVTILANTTTATISVSVRDDNLLEDNETITVTLTGITSSDANVSLGATVSDTVTITDDDAALVTVAANDDAAGEPANDGQFTVTISNPSDTDTVISYTVSGDATPGSDYTALTGSVTILANSTTANIDVSVLDENLLEDNETVTVTLTGITSGDTNISLAPRLVTPSPLPMTTRQSSRSRPTMIPRRNQETTASSRSRSPIPAIPTRSSAIASAGMPHLAAITRRSRAPSRSWPTPRPPRLMSVSWMRVCWKTTRPSPSP